MPDLHRAVLDLHRAAVDTIRALEDVAVLPPHVRAALDRLEGCAQRLPHTTPDRDANGELAELKDRVRAHHDPAVAWDDTTFCNTCSERCREEEFLVPWPCPTIVELGAPWTAHDWTPPTDQQKPSTPEPTAHPS